MSEEAWTVLYCNIGLISNLTGPMPPPRRYRPHQKRGHYQTYWTGPGGRVPRLTWVAPYWVSLDLLGQEAPQTAVVRRVKKRP
jgi:hypothetical protein